MSQPSELAEAIRLQKGGQLEQSRQILCAFLQRDPANVEALLWLAKVSQIEREALAAAELALALQPNNEIAQRAVVAVTQRLGKKAQPPALDVLRVTGMTVAQARAINWPFRGLHRPMGVLLDEGVIGLNDLGFAVQKAYDAQLKRAANTLLLEHLLGEGLKAPPPPLKITGESSHTARNERLAIWGSGIFMGFVLVLFLVLVAYLVFDIYFITTGLAFNRWWGQFSCLLLLILVPLSYGLMRLVDWFFTQAENHRAGVRGERRVSEALQASLSSPWALFRNVNWPNRRWGDTDLILVGPGGIWAFEVKAYSVPVRNQGDQWQYKRRWGWGKLSRHPGQQARRNAVKTKNYLELHGAAPGYVNAVVIWAGEEALTVQDPATPVWKLSDLSEALEELWERERLSPEQVSKCCSILAEVIAEDETRMAAKNAKDKKRS